MSNENEFLLHALYMGIFLTFVYDLLRIFRRVVPHNGFFISMEDLLFWIYCGEEVFLLMYHESDGTLRWFAVLGAMVGMFLYRKLVSPLFVKYTSLALCRLLEFLRKVLHFLSRPLVFLMQKTGNGIKRTRRGTRKLMGRWKRSVKNRLTYFIKMLKMTIKT